MRTRNSKPDRCLIYPRNCVICQAAFIGRHPQTVTCSAACSLRRRNRSDDYHRNKRRARRALTRYSDITPAQSAAMFAAAGKCPLCKVRMTAQAGQSNSKQLDHIVPINVGGTHTHGNVRIICRTCNLERPKDGSDYTGPVTLWAQLPDVVTRPKPVAKAAVKPEPKPLRLATCTGCTGQFESHHPNQRKCSECISSDVARASAMRASGMKWQDICDELDYESPGALHNRVMKFRAEQMGDVSVYAAFLGLGALATRTRMTRAKSKIRR